MARKFILQQCLPDEPDVWNGTNHGFRTVRFATIEAAISRAIRHMKNHPGSICRVIKPDQTIVWQPDQQTEEGDMYVADFDTMLSTVRAALLTIAKNQYNHQRRDERLQAVQRLIWHYMEMGHIKGGDSTQYNALRQIYEMCFEHEPHETHTAVRGRCYLIIEMLELEINQHRKEKDEEQRNRSMPSSLWTDALDDTADFDGEEGHTPDDDSDNFTWG